MAFFLAKQQRKWVWAPGDAPVAELSMFEAYGWEAFAAYCASLQPAGAPP